MASWVRKHYIETALFCIFSTILTAFVIWYLHAEKMFYYWDYLQYQEKLIQICSQHIAINKRFDSLLYSIQHDSYTDLGVYPLLPFCSVFGASRMPYILYIYFLYGLPTTIVLFLSARRYARFLAPTTTLSSVIILLTAVLAPQLWAPVLMGFIDISGLICVGVVLLITFRKTTSKFNVYDIIGIVTSLIIMILLRRWYAYWAVGYVGGLFIESLLFSVFQKNKPLSQLIEEILIICIITICIPLALFLIGGNGLIQRFMADYASIYYPWKFESTVIAFIGEFTAKFGLLVSLIFIFGVIFQGVYNPLKSRILFLISSFCVTYFLFHTVQSFGPQHLYLLLPTIIIIISTTISLGITRLKGIRAILGIVIFIMVLSANFIWVFVPMGDVSLGLVSRLFSQYRHPPLARHDMGSIKKLLQKTQSLYIQRDGWVTLVASSEELNASLLRNACEYFQFKQTFCNAIALFSGVDVDGFPDVLFNSTYLLVAEPTQTHLRASDQRALGIFAEEIKKSDSLGQYFQKITPGYTLDKGITVYIYIQKQTVPMERIKSLFGDLVNIKPPKF